MDNGQWTITGLLCNHFNYISEADSFIVHCQLSIVNSAKLCYTLILRNFLEVSRGI